MKLSLDSQNPYNGRQISIDEYNLKSARLESTLRVQKMK